jgi:inhibitor of KinA sporulation pathway (predicted exonuclease)
MLPNFGKVIVIDLEMTCWGDEPPPEGQSKEIIEIGICLLNCVTLELSRPRRIFIKPHRSTISEYCVQLTGITQDILDAKGISLNEAYEILVQEFKIDERIVAAWGSDCAILEHELSVKFNQGHINLCALFSILMGSQKRIGLNRALKRIDLNFEGIKHSGGDDALNAAKILQWMIKKIRL